MKHLSLLIEGELTPEGPFWRSWSHCVSWREVRKLVRAYGGHISTYRVERVQRRRPDRLSRTMNRIGLRALKAAGY